MCFRAVATEYSKKWCNLVDRRYEPCYNTHMNTVYKLIVALVVIALTAIGAMHYENYRSEQAAFEAMGDAQMLREQLREPEPKQ